jgi:uncharacterized membrane protein
MAWSGYCSHKTILTPRRMETSMQSKIKSGYDLLGVFGLSLLYLSSLLASLGSAFQILLGLPFALVLPGYALLAVVYPDQKKVDLPLRLALGCVLSLTLVTLFAMGLNAVGLLDLIELACSLELTIIACCILAYGRRSRLAPDNQSPLMQPLWKSRRQSVLVLLAGILVMAVFLIVIHMIADLVSGEQPQTYTTAFYLLGEDGRAGNYPNQLELGHPFPVTLGIINNERDPTTYLIEMQVDNQAPEVLARIRLEPGETWERLFDVTIGQPDNTLVLVGFNLYKGAQDSPYRCVHQRVRVVGLENYKEETTK